MQNKLSSTPSKNQYYLGKRTMDKAGIAVGILVFLTNLFVFIVLPITGSTLQLRWLNGALNVIVFLILIIRIYAYFRVSLIISSEGIEYRQVGYRIYAEWKDIEYIGSVPAKVKVGEGLVLRQSCIQANKWLGWLAIPVTQSFRRYIPLSIEKWRDGEIGQDLQRHAPHLFTDEKKKTH